MSKKVSAEDYSEEIADRMVARYDSGIRAMKLKLVGNLLANIKGRKVLDIGAGIGNISSMCCDLGAEVVATDYSPSMIMKIRERHRGRFGVLACEANSLPFCSNHFDVVLLLDVIEHLYKVEETISEIRRVMKPGGKFIITTPKRGFSVDNFHRIIKKELYLRIKKPFEFEVHLFKPQELINILRDGGFELISFDTFLNSASYRTRERVVEKLMSGRLKRFKWGSAIYEFRKEND